MKNSPLFLIILFIVSFSIKASSQREYRGNDIRFEQIGANQFKLILRIASTCASPATSQSRTTIFDKATHGLISSEILLFDSSRIISQSISSVNVYFRIDYYSKTITLSNNSNGYYAVTKHCCRENNSNHGMNGGITYTCDIPNPSISLGNSNPKFINYPDRLAIDIGNISLLDFSCTDVDGDSLVYSLINPYDTSVIGSKPFPLLNYNSGYNISNIIGTGASISINSSTGIVSAQASAVGAYIISVKCEEFRGGIPIGEVVREIMVLSINFQNSTILKENKNLSSSIAIYPNPSNGIFQLNIKDGKTTNLSMKIYSLSGKLIQSNDSLNSNNTIDLHPMEKGIYFIHLQNGKESTVKKIVIN